MAPEKDLSSETGTEPEAEPAEDQTTSGSLPQHTLLLDLNVVLDVLQKREPHYEASARVWAAVEEGDLKGFVAAHSVTTLFYLLTQHLDRNQTIAAIHDLVEVFSVARVDEVVIRHALSYGWRDFEDAVQMAAAAGVDADFLITRNPKDFPAGPARVLRPAELPAILPAPSTPHTKQRPGADRRTAGSDDSDDYCS